MSCRSTSSADVGNSTWCVLVMRCAADEMTTGGDPHWWSRGGTSTQTLPEARPGRRRGGRTTRPGRATRAAEPPTARTLTVTVVRTSLATRWPYSTPLTCLRMMKPGTPGTRAWALQHQGSRARKRTLPGPVRDVNPLAEWRGPTPLVHYARAQRASPMRGSRDRYDTVHRVPCGDAGTDPPGAPRDGLPPPWTCCRGQPEGLLLAPRTARLLRWRTGRGSMCRPLEHQRS